MKTKTFTFLFALAASVSVYGDNYSYSIILSGFPPADVNHAVTSGTYTVEAAVPSIAVYTVSELDARTSSVAESSEGSFSSEPPGTILIIR
jgi:hypothetical protein